jgi:hypothetical protein
MSVLDARARPLAGSKLKGVAEPRRPSVPERARRQVSPRQPREARSSPNPRIRRLHARCNGRVDAASQPTTAALPDPRKLSTPAEALHDARDDCFQPNPAASSDQTGRPITVRARLAGPLGSSQSGFPCGHGRQPPAPPESVRWWIPYETPPSSGCLPAMEAAVCLRLPGWRLRRSEASPRPASALTRSFAAELLAGGRARARVPRNGGTPARAGCVSLLL